MSPVLKRLSGMSLLLEMSVNGSPLAAGTGFMTLVDGRPVLVTTRHNLSGRHHTTNEPLSATAAVPDAVTIHHHRARSPGTWVQRTEKLIGEDGLPLWLEHPRLGRRMDVVALPVNELDDVERLAHEVDPASQELRLAVAEPLNIIGFPFAVTVGGGFPVWVRGFIASEPDLDYLDLPIVLVDSRTRRGQSGSPVVLFYPAGNNVRDDRHGRTLLAIKEDVWQFVGVYSGRIHPDSDLGLVWKASAVWQLLQGGTRPCVGWDAHSNEVAT